MMSRRILVMLTAIGALAMAAFLYLFVSRNAPGLVHPGIVVLVAMAYGACCLIGFARLIAALKEPGDDKFQRAGLTQRLLLTLLLGLLVYLFLESAVTDYYQPLSLFDDAIAALAAWWSILIIVGLVIVFSGSIGSAPAARTAIVAALLALATWPVTTALEWINTPQPDARLTLNQHVFLGGEDGYDTYRIPGMVVIARDTRLADGTLQPKDRLVAFAEARRDAALDGGVVDLVVKISEDGGTNWSPQIVICQNQQQERRGKCGNPTPVFDAGRGTLILAYNLSGTELTGPRHGGYMMHSRDGGLSWGESRQVTTDNFVFGPGKGIQKTVVPEAGRLLIPGYVHGTATVLYSDDGGENWLRGEGVAGGDETDVAELPDGRLYMTTRHPVPISRAPEPNGRQFSLSSDGGASWLPSSVDTALPTPVCQASVLAWDGGLLFANPAHHRARVAMTLRHSPDGGTTWPSMLPVYPGPSGYSTLASGSGGDVFLLYENGDMAYSDRISLTRVSSETMTRLVNDAAGN